MAERTFRLGSFGEFPFDDEDAIDAEGGVFETEAALLTDGPIRSSMAPAGANDVVRKADLASVAADLLAVISAQARRQLGVAIETAMRLDTERAMRMSLMTPAAGAL